MRCDSARRGVMTETEAVVAVIAFWAFAIIAVIVKVQFP